MGPEGTFTHQAADHYFGRENYEPVLYRSVRDCMERDGDFTVVPFQNSLQGRVDDTVTLLHEEEINIVGEKVIPIENCLLSNENGISEIDAVKSHPKALGQCRDYISKYGWDEIETTSTARAAQDLDRGEAAIASELAGEIYDLNLLERSVQDCKDNKTRFLILGEDDVKPKGSNKTSLILDPYEDSPGLLARILTSISSYGINLSHIHSKSTKNNLKDYIFYLEADVDSEDERFKKVKRNIRDEYAEVEILGSYRSNF